MFNGRPNDHITAVRARHCAADQNDFLSLAHLHHLKILHGHALVTEVTWHSLVLPDASRRRTIADCADAPMRFRTVRRTLAGKVMFLHHALKSFSLRAPDHVHIIPGLKLRNAQIDFAFGKITHQTKLAHKSLRLDSSLLESAEQRFTHARFFLYAESNLHRRIAFVFYSQTAQQNVIASRYHRHRMQATSGVVNAGHTNFLSKKSDAHDRAIAK